MAVESVPEVAAPAAPIRAAHPQARGDRPGRGCVHGGGVLRADHRNDRQPARRRRIRKRARCAGRIHARHHRARDLQRRIRRARPAHHRGRGVLHLRLARLVANPRPARGRHVDVRLHDDGGWTDRNLLRLRRSGVHRPVRTGPAVARLRSDLSGRDRAAVALGYLTGGQGSRCGPGCRARHAVAQRSGVTDRIIPRA